MQDAELTRDSFGHDDESGYFDRCQMLTVLVMTTRTAPSEFVKRPTVRR